GARRRARAHAQGEAGHETGRWDALDEIASDDADAPPAAREADVLVHSPTQNPYEAWRDARKGNVRKNAALVAFGPLAHGARDRDLPRSVEWLLEAPTIVPMLGGIPWRLRPGGDAPPRAGPPAGRAARHPPRLPH